MENLDYFDNFENENFDPSEKLRDLEKEVNGVKTKIDKEKGIGTISWNRIEFHIKKLPSGGIEYWSNNLEKGNHFSGPDFKNKKDLAIKMSEFLTWAFEPSRPNMRKALDEIYDSLELEPLWKVSLKKLDKGAYELEWADRRNNPKNKHKIMIKDTKDGFIYKINNGPETKLYTQDDTDLIISFGSILNKNFGTKESGNRPDDFRYHLYQIYRETKSKVDRYGYEIK